METDNSYKNNFKILPIKLRESYSSNCINFYLSGSSLQGQSTQIKTEIPFSDNNTIKYYIGNSSVGLYSTIHKRYMKLKDGLKNGNKIVNEVKPIKNFNKIYDESFRNPPHKKSSDISISTSSYTQRSNNNSPKKIVIYEKPIKDYIVIRRFECNEYFQVPIFKKRDYSASDIRKIVRIQKNFRGFEQREIIHKTEKLRVNRCSVELFCLLIIINYFKARKRLCFYKLLKEFPNPFDSIGEEMDFKDRLKMGMIDRQYKIKIKTKEMHNKIPQNKRAKSAYKYYENKEFIESL